MEIIRSSIGFWLYCKLSDLIGVWARYTQSPYKDNDLTHHLSQLSLFKVEISKRHII